MHFTINRLLHVSAHLPSSGSYTTVVKTYSNKRVMQKSYISNVQVLIYLLCMYDYCDTILLLYVLATLVQLPEDGNCAETCRSILTHCGRVTQICVFNTVKLGTSVSSPQSHSTRGNVSRGITTSSTTRVFDECFLKISVHKSSQRICYKFLKKHSIKVD